MTGSDRLQRPRLRAVYVEVRSLLGRGSSVLRDANGEPTLEKARALSACSKAGVEVVIVFDAGSEWASGATKMLGLSSLISMGGLRLLVDETGVVLPPPLDPDVSPVAHAVVHHMRWRRYPREGVIAYGLENCGLDELVHATSSASEDEDFADLIVAILADRDQIR